MVIDEILKELPELSIKDLQAINLVTCKVIKLKAQMKALEFFEGDKVTWDSKEHGRKFGIVKSVRGRTVNVITIENENWKVSGTLLTKIK